MTAIRKRMINKGKWLGQKKQKLDKMLKKWLKNPDESRCPWHGVIVCKSANLCKAMFPRLKANSWTGNYKCPCHQFPVSYVAKRAREALK